MNPITAYMKRIEKRYFELNEHQQFIGCLPADGEKESVRYAEWRKAILERDLKTCVLCDATEWIQAHHIERWIDNPKRRYDLKNGVSLCFPCHEEYHGVKGKAFPIKITKRLKEYIKFLYK